MSQDKKEEEAWQARFAPTGGTSTGSLSGRASDIAFVTGELIAERYKVLSLIGAGASGSVYEVEQVFMKRRFALKTLNAGAGTAVLQRRFQKEAQTAGMLEHPNLVRAVDFGILSDGRLFMVMDFVEGENLSQRLKAVGRLALEEALEIFIPVCFGIDYAHEHGIIHRDIKPSNIVLQVSPESTTIVPMVVDFGIARLTEEAESEGLTRTGEVFGTPYYMSPEQCSGQKVDRRSDIYSLGCVLYEVLTGSPPFCSLTALETMMRHRTEIAAPLSEASLGVQFSTNVEAVVQKMLAKEPADRYQTCAEVAEELMRLKSGENIAATGKRPAAKKTAAVERRSVPAYLYFAMGLVPAALLAAALVYVLRAQLPPVVRPGNANLVAQKSLKPEDVSFEPTIRYSERVNVPRLCQWESDGSRTFNFGTVEGEPNFTHGSEFTYQKALPGGQLETTSCPAKGSYRVTPGAAAEFSPSYACLVQYAKILSGFKHNDLDWLTFGINEMLEIDRVQFNACLAYASEMDGLKQLKFFNVPVSTDGLSCMKIDRMKKLMGFSCYHTLITPETLSSIKMLPAIKKLELSGEPNARALLAVLKRSWKPGSNDHALVADRELSMRRDSLTDVDMATIARLGYGYLNILDNRKITDDGLKRLLEQKDLRVLIVDGNQFERATLLTLARKLKLNDIDVGAVGWSDVEKRRFASDALPCKVSFGDLY